MKKIIIVGWLVLLVPVTGVFAQQSATDSSDSQGYSAIVPSLAVISEWVADFIESYNKNGVYQSVEEVHADGRTPKEIVDNGLAIDGMNPQNLTAALYCAGANYVDIQAAVRGAGISEGILVAGFETAKTVCGDEIADTQAYTPLSNAFAGIPEGGGDGNAFGSISNFTQ